MKWVEKRKNKNKSLIKFWSWDIQSEGNGRYWQPYTLLRHGEWDVSGPLGKNLSISAHLVWKKASYSEGITRSCEKFKEAVYKIKYSVNVEQAILPG